MRWWQLVIVLAMAACAIALDRPRRYLSAAYNTMSKEIDRVHQNGHLEAANEPLDVLVLPQDAASISGRFAEHLHRPGLEQPLRRFFGEAAAVSDLAGVGLAVWERPQTPPFLSIYALSDFATLGRADIPSPRAAVAKAYDALEEEVRALADAPLGMELSFVNAPPGSVPDLAGQFPQPQAPFFSSPTPDERLTLKTLAACCREAPTLAEEA